MQWGITHTKKIKTDLLRVMHGGETYLLCQLWKDSVLVINGCITNYPPTRSLKQPQLIIFHGSEE